MQQITDAVRDALFVTIAWLTEWYLGLWGDFVGALTSFAVTDTIVAMTVLAAVHVTAAVLIIMLLPPLPWEEAPDSHDLDDSRTTGIVVTPLDDSERE